MTSLTPGQVFARRVKEARLRQGLTQRQLANRLGEYGLPTDRTTVVKLEKGERSQTAPLDRVFAFASALGVAPVHLFVPLNDDESVAIGGATLPARLARAWVRGLPLPFGPNTDLRETPPEELRELIEAQLWRDAQGATPIVRALVRDQIKEEARRLVDEIHAEEDE